MSDPHAIPFPVLEAIAHNLCSLHDFDPAFVAAQEGFARAVITEYLRATAPASADQDAAPVETYGLTTFRRWKLFEVDGWQALASLEPAEDDDTRLGVRLSVPVAELGEVQSLFLSGKGDAFATAAFDALDDGRKVLKTVLDQVGPLIAGTRAGAAS